MSYVTVKFHADCSMQIIRDWRDRGGRDGILRSVVYPAFSNHFYYDPSATLDMRVF